MSEALVCLPVLEDGRPTRAVAHSVITQCSDCRCDVWIAPSGVDNVANHPDMIVICTICVKKYIRPDTEVAITAETLRELREELG